MKKTLAAFLLAMTLLPAISHSQLRMALLGGPQKSTVSETNNLPGWETSTKPYYKGRNGFHIGIIVEVPLGSEDKWFLQPGIMYSTKGRHYLKSNGDDVANQSDTISFASRFHTNYIDIPFNLAYKIRLSSKTKFLLSAGPYLGFFYNGTMDSETRLLSSGKLSTDENQLEVGNATGKVKTLDAGINARAGFEIGSVLLTGYYSKGLTNFYNASYDGSLKHQVIGASLGFWLNRPEKISPKVRDKDHDGIIDSEDECPSVAGAALTHGCPDRDGDGIADLQDRCPDVAGLASKNGCPFVDADHDGIANDIDKCPDVAGVQAYSGCPIPDSDGDGIKDDVDSCKNVAGVAQFHGCPVRDRDGDGVNDNNDKCPDVPGIPANSGCPEIRKEVIQQVYYAAENILFQSNSDKLTTSSYKGLDKLANLLDTDSTLRIAISGHTDNVGSEAFNKGLSERRAAAVATYLVAQGVAAERLVTAGYGASKPIDSNATAEGRFKNRRVELNVTNN